MARRILALLLLLLPTLFGQASSINGEILGTVTDATGAAIAAQPSIINQQARRGMLMGKNIGNFRHPQPDQAAAEVSVNRARSRSRGKPESPAVINATKMDVAAPLRPKA